MPRIIMMEKELKKRQTAAKKAEIQANKIYKPLSGVLLYTYRTNLNTCERLFLVKLGEFPTVEQLQELPIPEARKLARKLNKIFDEKAEERHLNLTGKTMMQAAVEKLDRIFDF